MRRPATLRETAALLLVLATIVFLIGAMAERSIAGDAFGARPSEVATSSSNESAEEASEGTEDHDESEAAEGTQEDAHADDATAPHREATETSETILGINPESTAAVTAAVVISLLLAAALWFSGTPSTLVVAAVFALLFAALDVRELLHQVNESRSGLAVVALLATTLHIGAAVAAGLALTRRGSAVRTP